jgi:hypothetical protein
MWIGAVIPPLRNAHASFKSPTPSSAKPPSRNALADIRPPSPYPLPCSEQSLQFSQVNRTFLRYAESLGAITRVLDVATSADVVGTPHTAGIHIKDMLWWTPVSTAPAMSAVESSSMTTLPSP